MRIFKISRNIVFIFVLLTVGCVKQNFVKPSPLANFKPAFNIKKLWEYKLNKGTGGMYLHLNPVLQDKVIFLNAHNGEIAAVDTQSGHQIWHIKTRLNLTSGLAIGDGLIFVGTSEAQLVAIKQNNGFPAWWRPMRNEVLASPSAAKNVVVAKAEDGEIRTFNTNGKLLWTYTADEPNLILRGGSSPLIWNNYVVSGFANGKVVLLRLQDGIPVWINTIAESMGSSAIERMIDIDVDPHIAAGIIYVASYQGNIAALALHSGKILWHHKLSSYSGLTVGKGKVFVTDDQGLVWAFDTKTGAVLWQQRSLRYRGLTAPVLFKKLNAILIGDAEGYVHLLAQDDGHFLARARVGKQAILAAPVAADNAFFVYSMDGRLVKFGTL